MTIMNQLWTSILISRVKDLFDIFELPDIFTVSRPDAWHGERVGTAVGGGSPKLYTVMLAIHTI